MNKRRLNTIIADLRFVAGESGKRRKAKLNGVTVDFYMADWCDNREAIEHHSCDTAACAIGTHCLMHPRAKLKLVDDGYGLIPVIGNFSEEHAIVEEDAIAEYLEIDENDALKLFFPGSDEHHDATPAQMARVLETYRDTGDAEKALEVLR